jgi:hypothetical protein
MAIMDRDRWRALEPLLDHALDLSDDERESWLAELHTDAPAIAAELRVLLSGESAADQRGFLVEPLDAKLVGLELGGYTLERRLGQGGMGSVWLARRSDGRFEGHAAVKLLNLALLSEAGQARFRREGSVLARLTHPGIARLLDAGVSASGQPYLVLEHVDGERIDAYVAARALSLEERVQLFLQVLAAVGHAHANLIVHRDLKPSNILVTRDGTVKLLDFGIAKLLDTDAGGERTALTLEAGRAFTPEYAAPEQVSGDTITTATDVYAAGVLLYVLLSGRHPTAEGCRTQPEVVRALLEVPPTRLGVGDLDTVLGKALRKEPGERYQTVGALADDLAAYLRHEPVSARPASFAYRLRKFVRRNRASVTAAAVMAAGLVAATAFSVAQMKEARRQRDAAVYASRRADAQAEFQAMLMSQVGERPITMREILDLSRRAVEHQYTRDPRVLTTILIGLSSRYAELGDSRIRGSLLARAESLAAASGDRASLREARCDQADNLRTEGRYDEAERALQRADATRGTSPDPRVDAACLQVRADLENELGHGERSAPAIRRAIAIRDSLGERSDMFYIGLLSTLAYTLDRQKRFREAIVVYEHAMAMMDSTGRGETMSRAILQHDLAVSLLTLGETAAAERLLHDVLVRVERSDPKGHLPAQALIHYAHAALFEAHADSARKYFALLAEQAVAERSRYWEGRARFGLALAEVQLGQLAEARRTAARFERIASVTDLRSTDDQVTDGRILEAWLALSARDSARAFARVAAVLRANGYEDGRRARVFRAALILAAETALSLGRAADALRFARDARTIATSDTLSETRSAYVGDAELVEGRALLARGDSAAARAAIARGVQALRSGAGASHPGVRAGEALLAALGR